MRIALNGGWEFTPSWSQAFMDMEPLPEAETVRLPHTCRELPYDYFEEKACQMLCGYRRRLEIPAEWEGKRLVLTVEAAGHFAEVFLNGEKLAEHRCGYTAFRVDLTRAARFGGENGLVIRLDTREALDQPPFGFVVDYLTYGGLYREVFLDVRDPAGIEDVFLMPEADPATGSGTLRSQVKVTGVSGDYRIIQTVWTCYGTYDAPELAAEDRIVAAGEAVGEAPVLHLEHVGLWDVDDPVMYQVCTELQTGGRTADRQMTRIGFRRAEFRADGFYLNGKKRRLRGLNRHQSWPYVGYAMPESMQKLDADILKKELGVNAVRTSHYPQSRHFIDRCDELGLLVFTEIPGWQHIGGEAWKAQAVENVREMVTQYRNHPSIILWGVRINESADDDALYAETNRVCRELDPTRPTSGVRCIKKSRLLEDVYAYNDFIHDGTNAGCEPKKNVTPDMGKAYLISEYNGHMFPTKNYDSEYHFLEHALRHARVLDAAAGEPDIAGTFGWCMFDYNTHKDFGSGDRICYHGVTDMFRNAKLAAAVYAAQSDAEPVLEISSRMDIGEHPSGNMGKVYIITNADSVRMFKNGRLIREYRTADSEFKNLGKGPVLIDDYIGDRIAEEPGFSEKQAKLTRDILNYCAVHGFSRLPLRIKLKALWAIVRYRMTFEDAYGLYSRYIGAWGDSATVYRFEAVKDGRTVRTAEISPASEVRLEVRTSHTFLREGDTYDVAAVRVRAVDQNGGCLRFYQGPVKLSLRGPAELIGPDILTLRGGCGGTYVKTAGGPGRAVLTLENDQAGVYTVEFDIRKEA